MKTAILCLVLTSAILSFGMSPDTPILSIASNPLLASPARKGGVETGQIAIPSPDLTGVTRRIEIAVTDTDEYSTKVASCGSNEYLAVYILAGDIYGQRLSTSGVLIGPTFLIETPGDFSAVKDPDVACDSERSRYVIVWQDDNFAVSDFSINARMVYGSFQSEGGQLIGSRISVSSISDGDDEINPSVACNNVDHTCLVVYSDNGSDNWDIEAAMLSIGTDTLSVSEYGILISDYPAWENYADVAWGRTDGNYLVAWQYYRDADPDQHTILYAMVYDHHVEGSFIRKVPAYLIGYNPWANNQTEPAIAYNPLRNNFLIAFTYNTSSINKDILAKYINGDGTDNLGLHNTVAGTIDDEYAPTITWNGGADAIPDGAGADQYAVVFMLDKGKSFQNPIAQAVNGRNVIPFLIGDQLTLDNAIMGSDEGIEYPDICGSSYSGRYLAAWNFYHPTETTFDYDVYGMLFAPFTLFQPMILKP